MAEGWTARLVLLVGLWAERRGPLGIAQRDEGRGNKAVCMCCCVLWLRAQSHTHTHTHGVKGFHKVSAKKAHRR